MGGSKDSGAAHMSAPAALIATPEKNCPGVRKALRYYTERWQHWTRLRGASGRTAAPLKVRLGLASNGCPTYLLKIRKRKAAQARREWNRYFVYHFAWSRWLPLKWQRIGACETGYGRIPGNWRHYNSTYQGAFGFHRQSWDAFVPRADPKAGPYPPDAHLATPRQQYEVALAIYRMFGFSGWGCRGA